MKATNRSVLWKRNVSNCSVAEVASDIPITCSFGKVPAANHTAGKKNSPRIAPSSALLWIASAGSSDADLRKASSSSAEYARRAGF